MQCSPTIKLSYLERIFETHPCDTLSCLAMSLGLTPFWASSTIRCLTISGRGLPLTYTPPSWLTPPWPVKEKHIYKNTIFCSKSVSSMYRQDPSEPSQPSLQLSFPHNKPAFDYGMFVNRERHLQRGMILVHCESLKYNYCSGLQTKIVFFVFFFLFQAMAESINLEECLLMVVSLLMSYLPALFKKQAFSYKFCLY